MADFDLGPEVVARVREAVDAIEVVGEHVRLRRRGRKWEGLCPFHEERTPSFSVDPEKRLFYCFGCHRGGDIIGFVMQLEHLTFPEAVERLARRYGVQLPPASPDARRRQRERERGYELLEEAQRFFEETLGSVGAVPARRELERRGFPASSWKEFGFGYAPDAWRELLEHLCRRHPEGTVVDSGLAIRPEGGRPPYDRFRNRLMFPIRSSEGRLIAFGGRILGDGDPKYLNSPETPLFQKRSTLFCLERARKAMASDGQAVIVEGYFDCLSLHRVGVTGAVATLGTALTSDHTRVLRRLLGEDGRVLLCFDADAAGRRAAAAAAKVLLEAGIETAVVGLPAGKDPDDVVREGGAAAFRVAMEAPIPLLEFLLADAPVRPSDRRRAGLKLAPLVCSAANPAVRRNLLYELAQLVDLPPEQVEEHGAARADPQRPQSVQTHPAITGERALAYILVAGAPQWRKRAIAEVQAELLEDARVRRLLQVVSEVGAEATSLELTNRLVSVPEDADLTSLVAELVSSDLPPLTDAAIEAQLRVLRQQHAREAARRLGPLIEEAERRGDDEELARLQATKARLRRGRSEGLE